MADNYQVQTASGSIITIWADEVAPGIYANRIVAVGKTVPVVGEFVRPPDATAYAIGDVVGNSTSASVPLEILNCARMQGGSGYIVGAVLTADQKSITPSFRVHVFNTPPTQSNDNLPHHELYADTTKKVGEFILGPLTTPADTANSTLSRALDLEMRTPFACASGSQSLFFIFETLSAFTPAAGGKFTLQLFIDQN